MENSYILHQNFFAKENRQIKKKNLDGIIFTRACCSLGIVIYHYFCHSKGNFKFLYGTANASFGFIFVTSFFNISGACLYYNYPLIKSIRIFYYKRWKSIFPSYLICYSYFYITLSFRLHKLYFKKNISNIIFTALGLDGYFLYRIETWYLTGEWFLGAIIIIYFLYPLMTYIINKKYYLSFLIICFLNFFMYYTKFFIVERERNIITCITSFYFGIIAIKFKILFFENISSFIISFIVFVSLSKFKLKFCEIIFQIQGFSFFIIATKIGKYIIPKKYGGIFIKISKLSFNIYLFHHKIIKDILSINNPFSWHLHLINLSFVFLLTIICSKILQLVVDSIINSSIFKKFESFYI